jgi:hypothetical protein
LTPATTAAGSNKENAFPSDDHDEALLVVLSFFIAGIEIDPALGRSVLSADSA